MCSGRNLVLVLLFAALTSTSLKAQFVAKVGETAPPFNTARIVSVPPRTTGSWEALRGEAVVLEFWATWCGGCVENIPHINELARTFENRPIAFVSITDEEDSAVSRFLSKYPISGWVVTDPQRVIFRSYRVQGIPQTFLIDGKGVLQAITGPNHLDEHLLTELLEGRKLAVPEPETTLPVIFGGEPGAPSPVVQVLIRPAAPIEISGTSPGGEAFNNGRFEGFGLTLTDMIADAYEIPVSRIDAPEWCSQARYDVSIIVPHGGESERWPLLQETLVHAFHLQLNRVPVETQAYVLQRVPGIEPKIRVSSTSETNSRPWGSKGEFDALGVKLSTLAGVVGAVLHSEVFDETGMQGRYDFDLKWNHSDPSSISSAVREQLGLEVVPQWRPLEHLVVKSAYQPKTW